MNPSSESLVKRRAEGAFLVGPVRQMSHIIEQDITLPLLDFSPKDLEKLQSIRSIVVVGPSGAGKSSFVDSAREWLATPDGQASPLVIPRRIVSRPQRANDNLNENDFAATPEEFIRKSQGGIRWQRKMDLEGNRVERYAFEAVPEGKVALYSANEAFLESDSNLEGIGEDFFEHALIVYIYALPHIREKRLLERSPDIMRDKPEEAARRLRPSKENLYEKAHIILRTRSYESERVYAQEMSQALCALITGIKTGGEGFEVRRVSREE